MRQTFRGIPRDYEEAALVDRAPLLAVIFRVLCRLARPGLIAFAIVSVTAHWNESLWPLMATSSPGTQVLTVGLASFTSGCRGRPEWGVILPAHFFASRAVAGGFSDLPAAVRLQLHVVRNQIRDVMRWSCRLSLIASEDEAIPI